MKKAEAKAKRTEWCNAKFDIHSPGWQPKTPHDVKIHWMPEAESMKDLVKGCLARSYERYQDYQKNPPNGKQIKELVSQYMSGFFIVATWKDKEGIINQFTCTKNELAKVPEPLKAEIGSFLKTEPIHRGMFRSLEGGVK